MMRILTSFVLALALAAPAVLANKAEDKSEPAKSQPNLAAASKKIDSLIRKNLKKHGIKPNAAIDDATFVRRIYLDIAGRIPTIEEAEAFHASGYERKREKLIEDLLASEGYVSHYYNFWADVLRINSGLGTGARPAEAAYQLWLKQSLRDNKPFDQFARELVSGRGHIWDNGAAGYYQRDRGMPLDNMSNTVRIFLGTRLECAQCHNHPFDKWSQMDYFKMAAFSYAMSANGYGVENRTAMNQVIRDKRVALLREAVGIENFPTFFRESDMDRSIKRMKQRKQWDRYLERYGMTEEEFRAAAAKGMEAAKGVDEEYQKIRAAEQSLYQRVRYTTTSERDNMVLKLPHDYQYSDADPHDPVNAATMFGEEIDLENIDGSTIDAYADWMTTKDNPTFGKVIANRLWKRVFGMGIIEPVDELTEQTVVGNPELMAYVEQLIKDLDFDMKAYLKVLYGTEAYQRTADANEIVLGEPYHFQGPALRRMAAEQIWDSIVGLALPEADGYRPRLKSQLSSVENLKLMYESLSEISVEEYIAMTTEIGEALADINPQINELRLEVYKAREEERTEDYNRYRQELRDLQNQQRKIVSDIGFKKLNQAMDGGELLAALGMSEMTMGADREMSMAEGSGQAVLTQLPKPKMPEPPADLERQQLKRWKSEQAADFRVYTSLVSQMARASELESPARRGHFLREFGQSDREVIENAAQHASVPQALNLLNGPIVEALTNKFAVFGSRVHAAGTPEDKTKMIFQAMLTRDPSEKEMEIAMAEIEAHGDRAYEGIVWALLNTQQFMFVQ